MAIQITYGTMLHVSILSLLGGGLFAHPLLELLSLSTRQMYLYQQVKHLHWKRIMENIPSLPHNCPRVSRVVWGTSSTHYKSFIFSREGWYLYCLI